jgi:hypothetical protein
MLLVNLAKVSTRNASSIFIHENQCASTRLYPISHAARYRRPRDRLCTDPESLYITKSKLLLNCASLHLDIAFERPRASIE